MLAGRKLLLAVSILHDRGFQRLRVTAGLAPSGCYWRYRLSASGSSVTGPRGSLAGQESIGWGDTGETSPGELADLMASSFPDLMEEARGGNSDYPEWLKMILKESEPDGLFIEFWDSYDGPCDHVRILNGNASEKRFPQPPR